MNKVIQLLESTKQKQEESLKQLPKMVDEHVATVAVEGEHFIKEIDQALLVLSNVVWRSEQFCSCSFVMIMRDVNTDVPFCAECGKKVNEQNYP